jgi:hypothetical protein
MTARRAFVLVWLISSIVRMPLASTPSAGAASGSPVTIDDIAAGIEKYISEQSKASGGYFKLQHNKKELSLQLVRVHLEYLADLGGGVSFACVDLVGTDGPVYDVDFFMKGPPGNMTVTETSVHKVNGQPFYAWEQKRNGAWRRVSVKNAPRRLLGVINGTDEFEFVYRAKLPEITGDAQIWLPLAQSDMFQRVEVKDISAPEQWRKLDEHQYGNKVLFLNVGPADSGKTIEVRYRVKRFEKSAYAVREPMAQKYLNPERLVPTNETFRTIAQQVTQGKTNDLVRARALYDHVIEKLRYAKVGPNQVLIVSGRKHHLPDGTSVGFRIVKGGGTFVFPIIEKLDVLSLEVLTIEMPKCKVPTPLLFIACGNTKSPLEKATPRTFQCSRTVSQPLLPGGEQTRFSSQPVPRCGKPLTRIARVRM